MWMIQNVPSQICQALRQLVLHFLLIQNFNCYQEFIRVKITLWQILNFHFCKKHQHFKISFYCYLKKTIPVLSCKTRVLVKLDWKDLIHLFHLKSISSKPCEIEVIFPFLHAVASMASGIGTGSSHSHSFPFTFPFLNSYLLSLRCRNKRVVGILLPDSQSCRLCIN